MRGRTFKIVTQNLETRNPRSIKKSQNLITVDGQSGAIYLVDKLDREKLCRKAKECFIKVKVWKLLVIVHALMAYHQISFNTWFVKFWNSTNWIPTKGLTVWLPDRPLQGRHVVRIEFCCEGERLRNFLAMRSNLHRLRIIAYGRGHDRDLFSLLLYLCYLPI